MFPNTATVPWGTKLPSHCGDPPPSTGVSQTLLGFRITWGSFANTQVQTAARPLKSAPGARGERQCPHCLESPESFKTHTDAQATRPEVPI